MVGHLFLLSWHPSYHLSKYYYFYLLLCTLSFLLFFNFIINSFELLLIALYLALMSFCFLGKKLLFGVVGLEQLSIAGLPNAIEQSSSQTVYCEDLATTVAEIDQDKHYATTIII